MTNLASNSDIRNIAIIAHVDHGKTTLVDQMFRQSGLFRENQDVDDRVMDRMDLERERGITIAAKNCSVHWEDVKINILDTPGHADFGGEVERALMMVDGAILLVDSSEGPLPQTRFVLQKALEQNLKIIVVINKIDRSDSRVEEVLNEVYDLFIDLDANEEQIDFPVLYAIGRDGIAKENLEDESENLKPLMKTICEQIPGPNHDPEKSFQMLVTDLDYSEYLGRLTIGRIAHGYVDKNTSLVCLDEDGNANSLRASKLQVYQGTSISEVERADAGEILILAGIEKVAIGDTICAQDVSKALPRVTVDAPTIAMRFFTNTSPLAGQEGKLFQLNQLRDRLYRETLSNVALELEEPEESDYLIVKGRGELQMAVLVETLRREGIELTIGRPEVIYKEEDGQCLEPIEQVYVDCGEEFIGVISEKLATRKGRMVNLVNHGGRARLQFEVPSRGLIGYRSEFLTDTKGTGIMSSYLKGYEIYKGDFPVRLSGSLVADRQGKAVGYALFHLEPRGRLFVKPGDVAYQGMVIGEHNRNSDLHVNVSKEKKLSNVRASGKDDSIVLTPITPMSLEQSIEFINDDEVIEVTPQSIRIRKSKLS